MSDDRIPADPAAIFLGPKAENADVLERLLLEAFRDHVFWRRNFHPEDGFQISEQDKRAPAYEAAVSTLSQELFGLLAELKNGVPFFSPRYVGHMTSDLTMASVVGYFATMLYNPNNVAAEGSPVTTRLELEVAAQLAAMVGYDPIQQWGHLCSGGTVANMEALWIARNVKYLPVSLHWAVAELGDDLPGGELTVRLPDGTMAPLGTLDLWTLLNIRNSDALDALDRLLGAGGGDQSWHNHAHGTLHRHTLSALGFQTFGLRLAADFRDPLPASVVLVPSTAHYSWAKSCRVLGVGESQLMHVPVDHHFRMDPDGLVQLLEGLAARRQAVMATVTVIGATEESAVDRLDLLLDVREHAARELGMAFHLHADAAWGGYAATITRDQDGGRRSHARAVAEQDSAGAGEEPWPDAGLYASLCALEHTDSITIDPHKLGFVPYPAGAVSFRDRRVRALVSVDAPYLHQEGRGEEGFIGRYILEGSKPGAAAASVWLSHKVLPLDAEGHGRLVMRTMRGALRLHAALGSADWGELHIVPLPRPDLNIVCFAVGHPELRTLEAVNEAAELVYRALSVNAGRPVRMLDYLLTKTVLRSEEYGDAALPLVERLGFTADDYRRAGGLAVLRCTMLDPFLAADGGRVNYVEGFLSSVRAEYERALVTLAG